MFFIIILQDDAISDFEEFESLEDVGNLIRDIMEENLLIKRRVNRVIQENQELSERVASLEEAVDELTEIASTELAVVQTTTEETTSTTTSSTTTTTTEAPVQIQTRFIDTSLMEENAERVEKLEEGVLIMMDQLTTHNNALEGVEGAFEARDSHMRRLREEFNQFRAQQKSILTLQRNAINQMENKYNFLERKISSTKKSSPPRSLSDTIGPVLEKVFGLARSSFSNAPAAEVEMDFMPQREFTNIAKVMWQLPTSCDELQARGLSENDSGKYLIRLENSENTIGVYCDFASGKTIFPFEEAGLEPLVINADTCGGEENSPCLPKNVTYGFSDKEIDSIQSRNQNANTLFFNNVNSYRYPSFFYRSIQM